MTLPVVRIQNLKNCIGQTVQVQGWLYNKRSKGKLHFLEIRDGSGIVQGVMGVNDVAPEIFQRGHDVTQESSITVTGSVREDKRSALGVEIGVSDLTIHGASHDYPLAKKEHGPDFLLSHRHLWLRSKKPNAIMRVRHTVIKAIRDYFDSHDFILIDSPIFTPNACEGTTTLFGMDYFEDEKAFLTQSGQLYQEAAATAFGKSYCFGPTFRAEKSKTRRHLTEFWMVEPEMAFAELSDVMDLAEGLICSVVKTVLEKNRAELAVLERDVTKLEKIVPPFPRISYDEAAKLMNDKGHPFTWGGDLGAPDEAVISAAFDKPVMIHRYPQAVKAFYMKRDPNDARVALCVDVIAPEGVGEIIGGGQREESLTVLEERIKEHQLPLDAFQWYLDLRRYGSVPHGGFGLGVERTVSWITGTEHVRECIPFPRMMYRIYP